MRGSRRRSAWRTLLRIVLVLVVVDIGASLAGIWVLRSSLPRTGGRLELAGPKAEIRIDRDADGVPTITAQDDADAAFGLGFVHAQDRLAQMELQRRVGAGRLSEIFGPEGLATDRLMRVLGLYRLAAAEIPHLSPEVRHGLEAYAAGVNAFIDSRRGVLPAEFLLLWFAPERWRVVDSLVWGKLMALQLGGDYRDELVRAGLARSIAPADLAILYPGYPPDAPTTLSALQPVYRGLALDRLYAALPPLVGPIHASNNWVVDGRHSASGKPLLANDPHLGFAAPGFWYLARLRTPLHDIAGGTAAGVPLVIVGHNERIAWGLTTTGADIEDLFIEKIDPADPGRYLTPDGSAPFATREETIAVRSGKPVSQKVRETRHGPVLSDILPDGSAEAGHVLSLSATFLAADDRSAEAIWKVDRAVDWPSFRAALSDFVAPPQNIVYADVDGHIGFLMPGRVPLRRKGEGMVPVPGWTGDYDWQGFIPFGALPSVLDPPAGRIVSANNKIVPASYPYYLGRGWDQPYRAERIAELLAATPRQTPQSSAAIQADTLSLTARRLLPLMTGIAPSDATARWALDRLRGWDFRMDRDKAEPLIFIAWLRAFSREVLYGRFGQAIADYWDLRPRVMETVLTWRPDWCEDPKQPRLKGCAAALARTLDRALAGLRDSEGPDPAQWRWGGPHQAIFDNPVLHHVPVLSHLLHVEIATSGGPDTVNRGATSIRDPQHPFEVRFGAGLRILTDLAQPAQSSMMIAPGQSGNPLSGHYADLVRRWRNFGWLLPDRAAAVSTLILAPAK